MALVAVAASASAQQRPPIRQLGAVTAKSAETFRLVSGIRALSNGSVLVNDLPGRRVLLFDSQLSKFTVVADSTSATANAYGGRLGALVGYKGDSSIFVDPASVSMLIIDPSGKIARVMAVPRAQDANTIGSPLGRAAFDASGRIVYRASAAPNFGGGGGQVRIQGGAPGGPGAFTPPEIPDSALIVRVDLATRAVDTLGFIRTQKIKLETKTDANGNFSIQSLTNPLPVVDDWAVLPDGTVAIVRGRDYHVDLIRPDGTKKSASKIPFDWQRLTDEDKVAFIDSVKVARERQLAANPPAANATPGAPNTTFGGGGGGGGGPNIQIFGGPGGPGGGPGGGQQIRGGNPQFSVNFVPASELPDYKPPFFANATTPDLEGNLWIATIPTSAIPGGPVYDVINSKGELVERVQVPAGRQIVGFGPGGSVFLLNRDGATATLERASLR